MEVAAVTQVGRRAHAALDDIGGFIRRFEMEFQFLRANRHQDIGTDAGCLTPR